MVSKPRAKESISGSLNKDILMRGILLFVCVIAVSACGKLPFMDKIYGEFQQKPSNTEGNSDSSGLDTPNKSFNSSVGPMTISGQSKILSNKQNLGKNINNLQPLKGIKLKELFSYEEKDSAQRIKRVEDAVLDMRTDLDVIMPSIVRLVAIESDIKNLIVQLESLVKPSSGVISNSNELDARAASKIPVSLVNKNKFIAKKNPKNISGIKSGISSVRIGHHKNKVRLVFDGDKNYNYAVDFDGMEKILVIEVKNGYWSGKRSWKSRKDPLILSYNVTKSADGRGEMIVMQLKHDIDIIKNMTIKPNKDSGYYRKIIDIKSYAIHK